MPATPILSAGPQQVRGACPHDCPDTCAIVTTVQDGVALTQTLGGKVGMKVEFFAEAKLILIWGSNSIASNLHFWRLAQEARRNGARLVCIDPRRSETAEKCHDHLQLLPGTDAALALA